MNRFSFASNTVCGWSLIFGVLSLARMDAASFTFVTFDYPGSTATILSDINNAGQIVGSFSTATAFAQGFIRDTDGSLIPIVLPFHSNDSPTSGINSGGVVVGAFFDPGTFAAQGYLRSATGTYSIIADPINPNNSGGSAINDSGQIAGNYGDPVNPLFAHSFLRDAGGSFTTIDDPNMATHPNGNRYTLASGINNAGAIVGSYTDAVGFHGFLRSPAGVFTTIDDPFGNPGTTTVTGINNLGIIIGTFSDSSGQHSFIRSADGSTYMTIDYPGGFFTTTRGINDSGELVGFYTTSLTGERRSGFIAEPATVPEPLSFALCLSGLGIQFVLRNRLRAVLSRQRP